MRRELALCVSLLGCGASSEAPPVDLVRDVGPRAEPPPAALAPAAPPAPAKEQTSAQKEMPAPRFSSGRFPPPDVEPPHARSAEEGDGRWVRLGETGDRAAAGEALFYVTTLHPHPVSRFDEVTVVAIDLAGAEIHFMPGSQDPDVQALDPPAGLVPAKHRPALLAVFNGGWLPRHGRWGMMAQGKVIVPPREEGCTVALYRDGRVRVRSWPAVAPQVDELRAYRQIPPCMVEQGRLHPLLEAHNERPWGGRDPKRKTRRRSAIGIDESGRVLFYGFGVEVGPELLARAMLHAGAADAAELDINWSWTRFLLFGDTDEGLRATSTLVAKMTHTRRSYVERKEERDFFYVVRR